MKRLILRIIRFYQKYFSFDSGLLRLFSVTGKTCRYSPTCSEYSYQAILRYGIMAGGWKALKRIIRCNPWTMGGRDPLR